MNIKKKNKTNPPLSRKALIIVGAVILLLIGGVVGYKYYRHIIANSAPTDSEMNLNPATDEEIAESNQHKEDIVKQQEKHSQPQPSGKQPVTPFIVDANQYENGIEVRSYIPGIVESSGVCTFTFTRGSDKIVKQATASPGATTMDCPRQTVPRSEFPAAGSWSVIVSYSSIKSEGSSGASMFEVK